MVNTWTKRLAQSLDAVKKRIGPASSEFLTEPESHTPSEPAQDVSVPEREFGVYDLQVQVGQLPVLIVAFSGVGDVANDVEVRFEWGYALEKVSADAHLLYIKDDARRWYTDANGHAEVVDYIEAYKKEHAIERTLAFGLSMGGYGALVFSTLTVFDDVVAMAARSCVGKASAFDSRNRALMNQIPEGPFTSVLTRLETKTRYTFLTSLDQVNDLKHFYHQYQAWPGGQFYVTRGDHNIGKDMNMRGEMEHFMAWVCGGCIAEQAPAGIRFADESTFALAKYLVDSGRSAVKFKEWLPIFGAVDAAQVPLFMLPNVVQQEIEQGCVPQAFPCPTHAFIAPPYLHPYLGMGWYFPESGGVWSQGLWHELKGRISLPPSAAQAEAEGRRQLRLSFGLVSAPDSGDHFDIESWEQGEKVNTFRVARKNKYPMVAIPITVEADGQFSLLLRTPETVIPANISDSTDTREIALFLKGFVIT